MAWKWKCSKQHGSIPGYHRYVLNFDDVLNLRCNSAEREGLGINIAVPDLLYERDVRRKAPGDRPLR